MKKRIVENILIGFLLLSIIITTSAFGEYNQLNVMNEGNILYVGGSGPGNYSTIQDAIDNAINGDIVFVFSGIYYEQVEVDKSITLKGEDRNTTIIDGMRLYIPISVEASFVNISSFTVQNSEIGMFNAGIKGVNVENIQISNCNIINNNRGLKLGPCFNISISNCDINSNINGVLVYDYSNIEIDSCHIRNTGALEGYDPTGISLDQEPLKQSNITIVNCNISGNLGDGIFMDDGGENINIHDNDINKNNKSGVVIIRGKNVDIHHNTVSGNREDGLSFSSGRYGGYGTTSDVCIYNNYISQNGYENIIPSAGIRLQGCYDCVVIKNNIFSYNMDYSVYLRNCSGNTITKNNFLYSYKFYSASYGYDSINERNIWSKNYWDRPRFLPKIIPGMIYSENRNFPWINFDWLPAKLPYNI